MNVHDPADGPHIVTGLDLDDPARVDALLDRLDPALTRLKIGKQLFTLGGPAVVERVQRRGYEVFLDLKFHDIPNTVAGAVAAAASLGVWMVNVHASGGPRMLAAAREAIDRLPAGARPHLIAVTVLTSHTREDLAATGIDVSPAEQVERLVRLSVAAGMDGVVCSAEECATLRRTVPAGFLLVTPGIRPEHSVADDQRRILTPYDAIAAGSDQLVMSRPVIDAADPSAVLAACTAEVRRALRDRPDTTREQALDTTRGQALDTTRGQA